MSAPRALLAIAHGTRDPGGVDTVLALLDQVRRLRPGLTVAAGFVDDASPSAAAALAGLSGPLTVLPLLLTAGSHTKGDIPAVVRLAREQGRDVRYGRPLGPHPALLEVLADRLGEAGVPPGAPVVLAGAGSADPDANAELARTARLLCEARGLAPVQVAFASATGPTVTEALDGYERLGHPRAAVAVVPYFLATGHFARVVAEQGAGAVLTAVLGAHRRLAELVLERYDEAGAGDLRMNCDVCVYRAVVAGRADLVGAPQQVHRHPDD